MIVMKFGGTSVGDAESIERVIEIIRGRLPRRPVVVVSAMGKTTRRLLEAAQAAAEANSREAVGILTDLHQTHAREARRLVGSGAPAEVFRVIGSYFDELEKLLQGLAILGEVPPRGLDKILAYGELLSSAILAAALSARALPARLLDARALIKTDDRFGGALPLVEATRTELRRTVVPVVEAGALAVTQGFIGSTRDGATTTLGFEGSDYTATLVGAALAAEDIEVWKDVSGLMTADPAVFAAARTVKVCSFAEAAELTYFGAKVLHPRAIHPAAQADIPVHIYNSRQPLATGTEITRSAPACGNSIKSIAYKSRVSLLRVSGRSLGREEFLRALLGTLGRLNLQPLVVAGSGSQAALALETPVRSGAREADLLEEVSAQGEAELHSDKAIVTLVGEELRRDAKLLERVTQAAGGIRIHLIQHGPSMIALHLVIDRGDIERLVARLHAQFFSQLDTAIFG